MVKSKDFYKSLSHSGYKWSFYENGLHHFKISDNTGHKVIAVTESDIEDGSWEMMVELGYSRTH